MQSLGAILMAMPRPFNASEGSVRPDEQGRVDANHPGLNGACDAPLARASFVQR